MSELISSKVHGPNRKADAVRYFLQVLFVVIGGGVATNLTLVYGLRISGFAAIPYVNLVTVGGVLAIQCLYLRRMRLVVRGALGKTYVLNYIFVLAAAALGFLLNNSTIHILAWTAYFTVNVLSLFIENSLAIQSTMERRFLNGLALGAILLLAVKLSTRFLNISGSLDNVMILATAVFFSSARLPPKFRILGGLLLASTLVGYSEAGDWQLEGNRAGFIAIYVGLVTVAFYQKQFLRLLPLLFVPVFLYMVALSLERSTVDGLSRNIREAVLLIQGDDLSNHVATQQRFFEAEKVAEDINSAGPVAYILGLGLGRTIDMSASRDSAVQGASITGADKVNNVHFLPVAIFHKFGVVGLLFHGVMWAMIARYVVVLSGGPPNLIALFSLLYLVVCTSYASSASLAYISSPYVGIFMALAEYFGSQSRRVSRRSRLLVSRA